MTPTDKVIKLRGLIEHIADADRINLSPEWFELLSMDCAEASRLAREAAEFLRAAMVTPQRKKQ